MTRIPASLPPASAPPARPGAPGFAEGLGPMRRVAIVHDYLNQRGGAERVALELSGMWLSAPIYTSLYRPDSTFGEFMSRRVITTFLDQLPVDRGFRNLFPLYPLAFRQLGEINADVVIASSSGWAHLARAAPEALHVVYCHTPARWLYGGEYLGGSGTGALRHAAIRPALSRFRRVDRNAASRADLYVANSENVRRRVKVVYRLEAPVVPPPIDVDRFRPTPRGERLLVISRLLPYKHVDLVIRAATRVGLGLDVVGDGPELTRLREIAGPKVTFHGAVDDQTVVELTQSCRTVCVAGEEDFGMVAVEAQAAGKPVVAYGKGGSLESVEAGLTGVFFHERTERDLIAAITAADALETPPDVIAEHAHRFSPATFRTRLTQVITRALEERHSRRR